MKKLFFIILSIIVTYSCSSDPPSSDINYDGYYMMGEKRLVELTKIKNTIDYHYILRIHQSPSSLRLKIFSSEKVKVVGGTLAAGYATRIRGSGNFNHKKELSGKLTNLYYSPYFPIPIALERHSYNWTLIPATEKNIIEGIIRSLNERRFVVPPHLIKYMSSEAGQDAIGGGFFDSKLVFNLIRNEDIQYNGQIGFKYVGDYSPDNFYRLASEESRHRLMTDPELKYFILRIDLGQLWTDDVNFFKDGKWKNSFEELNWIITTLKDPKIVKRLIYIAKKTGDMRVVEKITKFFEMFLSENDKAMELVNDWKNLKEGLSAVLPLFIVDESCSSYNIYGGWIMYIDRYNHKVETMNIDELVFPPYSRWNLKIPIKGSSIDFLGNCTVNGRGKWIWKNDQLTFSLRIYREEEVHRGLFFHDKIIGRSKGGATWIIKRANSIK